MCQFILTACPKKYVVTDLKVTTTIISHTTLWIWLISELKAVMLMEITVLKKPLPNCRILKCRVWQTGNIYSYNSALKKHLKLGLTKKWKKFSICTKDQITRQHNMSVKDDNAHDVLHQQGVPRWKIPHKHFSSLRKGLVITEHISNLLCDRNLFL